MKKTVFTAMLVLYSSLSHADESTLKSFNIFTLINRFFGESVESKKTTKTLLKEMRLLALQKAELVRENNELNNKFRALQERNANLEVELEKYKPQQLPELAHSDLDMKQFGLERIFRLRSARCFDHNGDMSCYYRIIKIDSDNKGYVLYKANRLIREGSESPKIVDKNGYQLNLLRQSDADIIRQWEINNPELLIKLMTH